MRAVVNNAYCFLCIYLVFFFFQAEDGIRDTSVTGVQTCALPICSGGLRPPVFRRSESTATTNDSHYNLQTSVYVSSASMRRSCGLAASERPGEPDRKSVV